MAENKSLWQRYNAIPPRTRMVVGKSQFRSPNLPGACGVVVSLIGLKIADYLEENWTEISETPFAVKVRGQTLPKLDEKSPNKP
jgi:uncharacterized protein YbdZ (MbtH family)